MTSFLAALVYRIPVIGWMLKNAIHGDDSELIYFLISLLLLWVLSMMIFGYAAMIVGALAAAATALTTIVVLTRA